MFLNFKCCWPTQYRLLKICLTITIVYVLFVYYNHQLPKGNDIENKHKIYVKFKSRLGNQMFEFASLYGIAQSNNKIAVITSDSLLLNTFYLSRANTNLEISAMLPPNLKTIYLDDFAIYHDKIMQYVDNDIIIEGYLQSWKYFRNCDDDIRKLFTFREEILDQVQNVFQNIMQKVQRNITFIGMHIRRTDTTTPDRLEFGDVVTPLSYIRNAIIFYGKMFENVFFIISSDDVSWVKSHFYSPLYYISEGQSPEFDLALLSQCNHSIMTIGTFGWWSSWLTNGLKVYYSEWPRKGSSMHLKFNNSDFYPPKWIAISD